MTVMERLGETPPKPARPFRLGEHHAFTAAGERFAYMPSGAVFGLDGAAGALADRLAAGEMSHDALIETLVAEGLEHGDARALVAELYHARLIVAEDMSAPLAEPPAAFPLQALVMNITNQCNLACTYCYEFGADKIATPAGKARYMSLETAKASVDFLMAEAQDRKAVHITFFGGETLMNFPLLAQVVDYARGAAAAHGKTVDFSLTTNATLLTDAIIAFLSDNGIGVTVSMDGPPDLQDRHRVYKNGKGSYAVIEPRLRKLLANHRSRAITARVTLTDGDSDVLRIYRHLKDELGFAEVGFAPVTNAGDRDYAMGDGGMEAMLAQFRLLAEEWLADALQGRVHGFSNVSETISELVQGVNKSHPCGAGLGLMGVSPSGELSPCHRFTDADEHSLGDITKGVDREKQKDFLTRGHVGAKYECHSCWARPLCAGGCHHEAFVRYGDTGHANLHYCDWIREWTDTCLKIYGAVAAGNPDFLDRFAARKGQA